jgi:hypothetical protein
MEDDVLILGHLDIKDLSEGPIVHEIYQIATTLIDELENPLCMSKTATCIVIGIIGNAILASDVRGKLESF